jgi:glycine C-acetyltransferase
MRSAILKRVLLRPSSSRHYSTKFSQHLKDTLSEIEAAGTYKRERILTSHQRAEITTLNSDKPVLNFCANNYLGLSDDAALIEAAKAGLDSHGFGLSSVRFICGTQDIHRELEHKIAAFHSKDDAILYASCFDANAGLFEALLDKSDAILTDKLNHASIIDGVRLCKAQRYVFDHMNMEDLEEKLRDADVKARHKMVVTDGAFSMDGDVAPLKEIVALAKKYDAITVVDDSHSTGFLGATGRGTEEHCGVKVDIINSTMGKALGGATGGYTCGPQEVVDILRQKSRPYLFSNSLAPSLVAATISVFDRLSTDTSLVEKLRANTQRFRTKMAAAGFSLMGDPQHPIAPVMLGDARLASQFADDMLAEGIYVIGFSFPVVPKGQARIRVQISAAHEFEHIDRAVDAFVKVAKKHGVLPAK